MNNDSNPYDASPSFLGYLYQTRFALRHAIRQSDRNSLISIETLDDVMIASSPSTTSTLKHTDGHLYQLKHHISRKGGLGNSSLDVWKSIRVWSHSISTGRIDPARTLFCLVTTSTATPTQGMYLLRPPPADRDPEKARETLEAAAGSSTDSKVQSAFSEYSQLELRLRKQLFESIHLLDATANVAEVRAQLETELRLATSPQHLQLLTDSVEGWWLNQIILQLMQPDRIGIRAGDVELHIRFLSEQYRSANLPDELSDAEVPVGETPPDDTRTFVRQLKLLGFSHRRIGTAQQDHYRACEQRSRWLRRDLLGVAELTALESKLYDEWHRRFDIMLEGILDQNDESHLKQSGCSLFHWIELDAPQNPALLIRPEFRALYMTRGSFHMLADKLVNGTPRIGWHPHFAERLSKSGD